MDINITESLLMIITGLLAAGVGFELMDNREKKVGNIDEKVGIFLIVYACLGFIAGNLVLIENLFF